MERNEIEKLVYQSFQNANLKQKSNAYFRSVMGHQPLEQQEVILDNIRFTCESIINENNQIDDNDKVVILELIDACKEKVDDLFEENKHIRHCYSDFLIISSTHPDETAKTLPTGVVVLLGLTIIGGLIWLGKSKKHKEEMTRIKDSRLIEIVVNIQKHINKVNIEAKFLKNFGISQDLVEPYFQKEINQINTVLNKRKIFKTQIAG